ncbi:DUF4159 domain-containing protein [Humisphaera borealis]|uniref:DUF4159 domain-containing protein n=1 Tax=Humisphaera borealis TaxID=2807512 RepID=A0A7M2WUS8_9BACT|nr:DUF4159 domain-containing protein [Humisphaera borealis]QOV89153.1 DUF4159 domain-containing protein [Humisphaera borealis]
MRRPRRSTQPDHLHPATLAALLIVPLLATSVTAEDFVNPKANIPPRSTPQRQNGGEGFPPLPLPATPVRRSEKKREPAPPALVGNITFPEAYLRASKATWETTTIDIDNWVQFTNGQLGQNYRFVGTDFARFSYDPAELPILYFTGWKPLPAFDDGTIGRLRQYLLDGGTWVVHSNCGRPEFNQSFRREIARIFPDRQLAPIGADHAIFSSFHKIEQMRIYAGKNPVKTVPTSAGVLETVNIGTRAAVIFSPVDMSCGWDASRNPIEGGTLFDINDSLQVGANIVTYCLAEYQYGRFFSHAKVFHQENLATRDQLVLGQVVHNGDWDATPHGLPNLLKFIDQSTTLKVQFKRMPVDLEKADIFAFPVLYMSGQRAVTFSEASRKRLKEYLDRGGTLIVDCVVGSSEFDTAFRREIKAIYGEKPLKPLPANHALYSFVQDTTKVRLSPQAAQLLGGEIAAPAIEAIEIDGRLPVIYSKLSLSAGWEQLPRAYNVGYADADALKLGVNVFMYAVSH